ncbi:DUF6916 family protein [Nocardioides sp. GXZ039]|uniref:DUF6916 family protein n=1 Tax=Nocardioides sp. GXZ039 TaxID=3136018 RepID=UPI0030F39431
MTPVDTDRPRGGLAATSASRRTVVVTAGLTCLVAAAPVALKELPGPFAAGAPGPLNRASFQPHVGSTFTVTSSSGKGGRAEVTLAEIADLAGDGLADDPDSFVLLFESDSELAQDTYELERRGFAAQPVFLVPDADGRRLGATFNRMEGPAA